MHRPLFTLLLSALCGLPLSACAVSPVAITLPEPPNRNRVIENFPVTLGLVFPEGEIPAGSGGTLRDDRGRNVPVEIQPTAWWSPQKTSVKWLQLHFRASTDRKYSFTPGATQPSTLAAPLARKDGERIVVNTGPLAVTLGAAPGLFETILLRGRPLAKPAQSLVWLTDVSGARHAPQSWTLELEEATPMYASIKATSTLRGPTAQPLARTQVRLEFYAGESWVRLYHTLTWLEKDVNVEAREYGLALAPQTTGGQIQIGVEGKPAAEVPLSPHTEIVAAQDDVSHFLIAAGGRKIREGEHLGGWLAERDGNGRSVALLLRHAWQNYPAGFEASGGVLRVKLWANEGGNLSFKPEAIMPPDYYNNPVWMKLPFSKDQKHYVHEFGAQSNFLHTGEGVAKTHEVVLDFFDAQTRSLAELVSVVRHPVIARQDPASVTRVPFMGFNFTAANPQKYPVQEAAVTQLGRMVTARWPQVHSYSFFRFGATLFGRPGNAWDFYRWFDGVQYNQQIIPWLLFLRGGSRDFFEEGEITARHAMDIGTNHYNTRGIPTGYMSNASAMPFPWEPLHLGLGQNINFLSYFYHLTGDRRAKEVMDEIIAGTKAVALTRPRDLPDEKGRYLYNINEFWADAYPETWDPQIARLARKWMEASVTREFKPQLGIFRSNRAYLFEGLVPLWEHFPDDTLRNALLTQLTTCGYKNLPNGGVVETGMTVGANWARRVDPNPNWDAISAHLGERIAELVPRGDLSADKVPGYPFSGNQILRERLLPILTGLAAEEHSPASTPQLRDFYMGLDADTQSGGRGVAWLRARQDGDLKLRLLARSDEAAPPRPLTAQVRDGNDTLIAEATLKTPPRDAQLAKERFATFKPPRAEITIPRAKRGAIYRITLSGGDAKWCVLILTDAQLVHEWQGKNAHYVMCQAGQYFSGTRFYSRAAGDKITVRNNNGVPYTIRDAATGALLYQYGFDDATILTHAVKAGQLLAFTVPGDGRTTFGIEGLEPFVSALPEMWFDPRHA